MNLNMKYCGRFYKNRKENMRKNEMKNGKLYFY
jgi:hypothetical protein